MRIRANRFNLYLAALVAVLVGLGCQSPAKKHEKEATLLRVHVEADATLPTNRCSIVQISRSTPTFIKIDGNAFLSEIDIKTAKVVEDQGGFAIQLQFDRRGSWALEQCTAENRNKHLAIFAQFASPTNDTSSVSRWLAAPKIVRRIGDGLLVFTPDATREESEQIVLGLSNVAQKLKKDSIWSY
jgi:hypothetical protein